MRELGRLDAVVFDAGGTLVRLDFIWDNYFQYNNAAKEATRVEA